MFFPRCVLGSVLLMLLIYSCKKEHSQEGRELQENSWEFYEDGHFYKGPADTLKNFTDYFLFKGSGEENPDDKLEFLIVGSNISSGTYSGSQFIFQYHKDGLLAFYNNHVQGTDMTIVVEINGDQVSGTFSGSVLDTTGNQHTITGGRFRGKINNQQGKLTVWSKSLCPGNTSIHVKVANQTGEVTQAMGSEPSCEGEGSAVFNLLPYGHYDVETVCGNDVRKYQVIINKECNFLQVFPAKGESDYLPLGINSFWEYTDAAHPSVSQILTAEGEVTIGGKTYTRVAGSRGNTYYYRKQLPDYYQYRTLSFQDFVEDPPSIEITILKDNFDKGEKWESEPIDLKISGIVQKVKLVSRIVERDYSEIYNGVEFHDLIKVNTELFFSPDGIGYATSGSAFNTVFSKGYGIVDYNDWDINIEWAIKNIFVIP